ncbi:1-phosphofructokinase family hexose kinase [Polymorphospora rubra]|uniref:1-phosphofructokinase n=1 Tax=Polymorphospora rubra TaxID=338584 RepID=A0A810N8D1_9ACTN|nr:PfkB family carbohydrate kinase [Polymorphospora rubra]BCJ70081.1 1-phosphofructokinase [Polymorphospora rubra]
MTGHVMVFAPAPLLTVTIEQQADAVELHLHPGGQGVWQARMIAALGVPATLCVAVGGEVGAVLRAVLAAENVEVRAVTRQAGSGWSVHDRRDGNRTGIAEHPGEPMVRHDIDELYSVTLAEGLRAPVSVLSGPADPTVVDPDVYRRLAADLTANGGRVVADLSGPYLAAVLDGGVAFVKVSHEELVADGRAGDDSVDELVAAAHQLRKDGAGTVLVSRADAPALALLDDEVTEVHVPRLQVVDHRGAGDSMSAGVAAVLARGGDLEQAVRTGAAAGALNVTRHGLGTGRAETIEELIGRVRLAPLDRG